MIRLIPCIFLIWLVNKSMAQQLPEMAFNVSSGYSRHGSGDLNGVIFGTEYVKYFSKRYSVCFNLRATINDGRELIIVNDLTTGTRSDNSIHFTTAGVQLGADAGFSLLRSLRHEFKASLGAFGRYQSASPPGAYSLYYPNQTNQPSVLVEFRNFPDQPRETFSAGGIFQLQYNFTFKNKMLLGLSPGIQTDSNGDTIPFCAIVVGRRF